MPEPHARTDHFCRGRQRVLIDVTMLAVLGWTGVPAGAQVGCPDGPGLEMLGTGTPGTAGAPALVAAGLPVVDGPFAVAVTGGLPSSAALLLLGLESAPVFLPKYGGTIHPGGPLFTMFPFTLDAAGAATLFAGSFDVSLCGIDVVLQVVVADPEAMGDQAFTNGLRFRPGTPGPLLFDGQMTTFGLDPRDLDLVDLDGDGHLDLAVPNFWSSTVETRYGNGDGAFDAGLVLATSAEPWAIDSADLNDDGVLDLVVALVFEETALVFLSTGPRAYASPLSIDATGPGTLVDVALANLDGDEHPDLLLSKNGAGIFVAAGQGDGIFGAQVSVAVGGDPEALLVADVDADGNADLVVSNGSADTFSVAYGLGDGTFPFLASVPTGDDPRGLAYGDVNGDGLDDIVVACWSEGTVRVHAGRPGGQFAGGGVVGATIPWAHWVDLADVDDDGDLDLLVAWSNLTYGGAYVLEGDGTLVFGDAVEVPSGALARGGTFGDVLEDGRPDVAIVSSVSDEEGTFGGSGDVALGVNQGDGRFGGRITTSTGADPREAVSGDFDADGEVDLIVSLVGDGELVLHRGLGDGTFEAGVLIAPIAQCFTLTCGDFDADGALDVAAASDADDEVLVALGAGDGTFDLQPPFPFVGALGGTSTIRAADIDGDGLDDLLLGTSTTVTPFLGAGDGTFTSLAPTFASSGSSSFAVADVDGDAVPDLVRHLAGDLVGVVLGLGDGSFGPLMTTDTERDTIGVLEVADVDGDGRADVVVSALVGVAVLLGLGDGTFAVAPFVPAVNTPSWMFFEDFNGDGHVDVGTGSAFTQDASVLLGAGDGSFPSSRRFSPRPYLSHVFAADVDGDGAVDVVALNRFNHHGASATISVQLNRVLE